MAVTSTAHVGLFGFGYCSLTASYARNITLLSNNVTDANSTNPGGKPNTGNAPVHW